MNGFQMCQNLYQAILESRNLMLYFFAANNQHHIPLLLFVLIVGSIGDQNGYLAFSEFVGIFCIGVPLENSKFVGSFNL